MKKRLYLVAIFTLIVLVLLLGACTKATPGNIAITQPAQTSTSIGSGTLTITPKLTSSVPTTTTTAKPATTATTTTTQAVNKYGGTVTFIMNETTPLMGYPVTMSQTGNFYAGISMEPLIEGSGQPYVYNPVLATSWELAPDRSSYTFHLRRGVKFHDGTDLNAVAVKWNFDNIIAAKRVELAPVSGVEVLDDYTLRVNLKTWTCVTLDAFASNSGLTEIISPTAYQKLGQTWCESHPTGTGPFLMTEMVTGLSTKYVKNPNYWNPQLPYLDTVTILAIKDPMTKQAVLLNGDADGARELDTTTTKSILDTNKFVLEQGSMGNFVLTYNSVDSKSPWSKPQMRMALEYALDKELMVDALGKGFAKPSYEVITGIWAIPNNNPGTSPRKYDPAKAAQLMKDAGYQSGIKMTLDLNQRFMNDFVTAIQAQLSKVGINVDINVIPQAAWADKKLSPPAISELRFDRARGGPSNPIGYIFNDLSTTSIIFPGVKRPDGWEALMQQGLNESDAAKTLAIVNQMEKKAYDDAFMIPVYSEFNLNVWNPKLRNDRGGFIVFNSGDTPWSLKYMYRTK